MNKGLSVVNKVFGRSRSRSRSPLPPAVGTAYDVVKTAVGFGAVISDSFPIAKGVFTGIQEIIKIIDVSSFSVWSSRGASNMNEMSRA